MDKLLPAWTRMTFSVTELDQETQQINKIKHKLFLCYTYFYSLAIMHMSSWPQIVGTSWLVDVAVTMHISTKLVHINNNFTYKYIIKKLII